MKILAINPISFKKRMIEFLFDYLFIIAYLALLFLGSMLIYIIFLMASQSLQKFSRSGLYFSPLFCQSRSFSHSWIMQKMAVLERQKRDFNWSTRKKQFRLA